MELNLIYNGVDISGYKTNDMGIIELSKMRNLLLQILKELRDCCNNINDKKVSEFKQNLSNRSIVRTLGK